MRHDDRVLGLLTLVAVTALGASLASRSAAESPQTAPPTFARDVAPILFANCTSCHRPGGLGPMSLLTYEDARTWSSSIAGEVGAGRMPPWHVTAEPGTFRNERRLTTAEVQTLVRWATSGTPQGDPSDLPPAPTYADGWTIGTPDAIVSMPRAFRVPATGTIEYQYFEAPTNFETDRWVQAIEILPGNRSVVHHVLVYAREPDHEERAPFVRGRSDTRDNGRMGKLIATTAPGTNAITYRPGVAMRLRAGTTLTFQMHYTAHGMPIEDRTSVGFVFADEPPAQEARVSHFLDTRFVIPPGARDHQVDSEIGFSEDVQVLGLFPHTHLRGTGWLYTLVYPDGRREVVLDVRNYDFNWQTYYMFTTPLAIPRGSRLIGSAWYDNSDRNPSNPDPTVPVRWGDQTWDEMQYTGITYTVDGARQGGEPGTEIGAILRSFSGASARVRQGGDSAPSARAAPGRFR
jgi:mono/diheme cytochrome c family protein